MKHYILISIFIFHSFGVFAQDAVKLVPEGDSIATLKVVKVSTKTKKPIELVNEKYTTGLYSNLLNARVIDYINNPPPSYGISILEYLEGKIPGLNVYRNLEGFQVTSFGRGLSLQNNRRSLSEGFALTNVKLYLDESEVTPSALLFIKPQEVALVKYFPPNVSQIPFNDGSGILLIYTRKVGDDYKGANSKKYKGIDLQVLYNGLNTDSTRNK